MKSLNPKVLTLLIVIVAGTSFLAFFRGADFIHKLSTGALIGFGATPSQENGAVDNTPETYKGEQFSFQRPKNLKIVLNSSPEGDVISVEDDKSGFQIFVMAFDEEGPITPERIKKDIPDAVINDPHRAKLDKEEALAFYGANEVGDTFEIWTIHNGKLYQIAGLKTFQELIIKTLGTWKWQ